MRSNNIKAFMAGLLSVILGSVLFHTASALFGGSYFGSEKYPISWSSESTQILAAELNAPMTQNPTLREYIDLRFTETQRAIDKAEATMNERLTGMNEFRATLKDQSATFVTRAELTLIMNKIQTNLDELNKIRDVATGKASQTSMIIAIIISIAGLGVSVYKTRAQANKQPEVISFEAKGK